MATVAQSLGRFAGASLAGSDTSAAVACTLDLAAQTETPLVIADVAYANGADPLLVEQLLKRKDILSRVSGYAGWNTTGNTTGSAVALGVAAWFSRHSQKAQAARQEMSEVLKQALFIRLADDWAYQTQVRKQLAGDLSQQRLEEMMQPYLERIKEALDFEPGPVEVTLPWRRSFEVEITLKDSVTCQPA